MQERVDIRLPEEWARIHLDPNWGQNMLLPHGFPSMTRQIVMETSDPRLAVLKEKLFRFPPGSATVMDTRKYSASELSDAPLLHLMITTFVDACGEDYGTEYDESKACPLCGYGRIQLSPLRLDLGKLPRRAGFATTMPRGDELLVSASLARVIREGGMTGCKLDPIEHVGKTEEQAQWYQLVITGDAGETRPPTRFAIDYLHDDLAGEFVCPEHRLSGLNLVSEVFLHSSSLESGDILKTVNRYGNRSGWLLPSPILLISQRFYRLLNESGVEGYRVEVAQLVYD